MNDLTPYAEILPRVASWDIDGDDDDDCPYCGAPCVDGVVNHLPWCPELEDS